MRNLFRKKVETGTLNANTKTVKIERFDIDACLFEAINVLNKKLMTFSTINFQLAPEKV